MSMCIGYIKLRHAGSTTIITSTPAKTDIGGISYLRMISDKVSHTNPEASEREPWKNEDAQEPEDDLGCDRLET
jgi:hypothetical protein